MNFKSIMLGAAAVGAVATGAQAADLPVAPEPVDYVRVCDAYGSGFYYIPGTDTCLKINGRVRTDFYINNLGDDDSSAKGWKERSQNGTSTRARGYIWMDARTNTEYGLLRAVSQVYFTMDSGSSKPSTSVDDIYIQFGNFTFGRAHSFYDYFTGNVFGQQDRNWSDHRTWLAGYSMPFGNGLALNVSLEDGTYSHGGTFTDETDTTYAYAGHRFPDVVAALSVNQGWGSAQVMGALHEARLADANSDAKAGFAVGAGVTYKLPMITAGDEVTFQANYVDGAMKYVNVSDVADIYPDGKTSSAWNVGGGYIHNWSATWQSQLEGSYVNVETPTSYDADYTRWTVAGNLLWKPVSGLVIGGEMQYASQDYDAAGTPTDDSLTGMFRVQRTF